MGRTGLSKKELSRVEVMGRVKAHSLRLCEAAEMLGLSYRQSKRIWARYRVGGAKALQHGNCGRVSNRAYTAEFRAAVLKQVQARYEDFGPTLACEHLASDDGLAVHAETLRRWMKEAGLWQRQRRRKPYRQRREPKAHFGELVQMDGSFHEWLEERGPRGCLMHMVDDATTQALGRFTRRRRSGRRWLCCGAGSSATGCRKRCTRTGRTSTCAHPMPRSACAESRRDAVWADVREAGHRDHRGQFAASQRASGAGARHASGSAGEETAAGWNRQLRRRPMPIWTSTISPNTTGVTRTPRRRQPIITGDGPTARQLDEVFWLEEERVVSEDWVVRYKNRLLQLERQSQHWAPAKSRVRVRENEAGEVAIHYRDQLSGVPRMEGGF